jgi:ribosomal 30S subunit maturation factor RimM
MGTTYNMAQGVQFFAPFVVGYVVAAHGLAGGLTVPLVLALATGTWVWTLPETRHRNLAAIGEETATTQLRMQPGPVVVKEEET